MAGNVRRRSCECPLPVTEQLSTGLSGFQSGHVDGNERSLGPRSSLVQGTGGKLLSGSTLPPQENTSVDTSKPAMDGQVKTGHRGASETGDFYPAATS
jgi:hypothetical protein